jgi:hypothetical protein
MPNYNFSISGQIEAVLISPDGTIKQRIVKKNTMTHGALSSLFCDFLFAGLNASTRERTYQADQKNAPQLDFVRSRLLGGVDTTDKDVPIYSYRQPETLLGYVLDVPANIKSTTQVPPYVDHTLTNLSPHVQYIFFGRMIDDGKSLTAATWANADDMLKMQYDFIRTWFDPQTVTYSVRFYAAASTAIVRSFVIGVGYNDTTVFETRTRPEGCPFESAGYSQFWAIEHRPKWQIIVQPDLSETRKLIGAETILWQDTTPRFTSESKVEVAHAISGYNITTGKTEYTPKTDITVQTYMGGWMQGLVIGDMAYSVSKIGENQAKITKYINWNTAIGQTPTTESNVITMPYQKGYVYSTNPVLVHNLETGYIEIIRAIAHDQQTFDVAKAVVDPVTLEPLNVYNYESPVAIGNLALSRKGDTVNLTDTTGTSALASTGFLDWRTGTYYLPQSGEMRNNTPMQVGAVTNGSRSRVGCMFKLNDETHQLELLDRYLICYPISGNGETYTDNTEAQTVNGQLENKFLEWGYLADGVVQFMPFTGIRQGDTGKIHPFTFVNPSRVMCGLDFDSDIVKAPDDVLRLTYSWRPTLENPLSPLLSVDAVPGIQSVSIVIRLYNPQPTPLQDIKGTLSMTTDPNGSPQFVYPVKTELNTPDLPYQIITMEYPSVVFRVPVLQPYKQVTLSFNVAFTEQVTYAGQVTMNPIPAVSVEPVLFGGTTLSLA